MSAKDWGMPGTDPAWDAWFDSQWNLHAAIDELLAKELKGKSKPYRVAVAAALVEHLVEAMRMDIDLPAADAKEQL